MEQPPKSGAPAWQTRLACELEARLDALVQGVHEAITRAVPAYEHLPSTSGFREGLERTTMVYCRTLAECRPLHDSERIGLHVIGSQRARSGLRAEDMIEAVRIAVGVGWTFVLRVLRDLGAEVGTVEAMSAQLFPLTLTFLDDVRGGLLTGYRLDGEEHLSAQVRAQATVIDRLLEGAESDEELYEVIRSQSLDIRPPCGLLLVTASSSGEAAQLRAAATAIAQLPNVLEGPGRRFDTPAHVVLLVTPGKPWEATLPAVDGIARSNDVVVLADDGPVSLLVHLSGAHQALERDLPLAPRGRRGPGVVRRQGLFAYRLLAHVPPQERVESVTQVLGPVLALGPKGEDFLLAYEAWSDADCDAQAAGEVLGEPAHTVRYRVKRVAELTGIDLDSGEGRVQLDLAIRLWRGWAEEVLRDRHARPRTSQAPD